MFRTTLVLVAASLPLLVGLVRGSSAPLDAPHRVADAPLAARIAETVAHAEPRFRSNALHHFPGDRWSQDDDFHNQELRLARSLAQQHKLSVSEVFLIIDADLHARRVPNRQSTAAPCKPRPFYD